MTQPALIVLGQHSVPLARHIMTVFPEAALYGLANRTTGVDVHFGNFGDTLRTLFSDNTPIISICAAGILIRVLAPLLTDKWREPPVLAVAEDGSAVVPLLGGLHGVNDLARQVAEVLHVAPAITTTGDIRFRTALLSPPAGYRLAHPDHAKTFIADVLAGASVKLAGEARWLQESQLPLTPDGALTIRITEREVAPTPDCLVYHPLTVAIGLCRNPGQEGDRATALNAVRHTLTQAGLASASVAGIFALDSEVGDPVLHALAQALNVPVRFFATLTWHQYCHNVPYRCVTTALNLSLPPSLWLLLALRATSCPRPLSRTLPPMPVLSLLPRFLWTLKLSVTEILALSRAARDLPEGFPAIKAFNPTRLPRDLAPETLLSGASLVLVRLLGGRRAWEDFNSVAAYCRRAGIPFLAWSGEQRADAELTASSTAPTAIVGEAFAYLCHGGVDNLRQLLLFLSDTLLMTGYGFEPATPLPEYGIYHPAFPDPVPLAHYLQQRWDVSRPAVGVLFYRAHYISGNREFIDALIEAIEAQHCNVLPIFCYSLRMAGGPPAVFQELILNDQGQPRVDCLLSTLSHSMGSVAVQGATVAEGWSVEFLEALNLPIVQAIACTNSHEEWQQDSAGLRPLDTAMTVAIPEFDGRIISVPFSFKEVVTIESTIGGAVTQYVPVADRVQMVVGLAVRLARLRHMPNAAKRVAILLSSYPTMAARLGNAVGLDSPASLLRLLHALRQEGYDLGASPLPPDSDSLIQALIDSGTYDREFLTEEQLQQAIGQVPAATYQEWFESWPAPVRGALQEAWGPPPGMVYRRNGALVVAGLQFGNVFVGIQPPRGFGENPIAVYHNADLVPPHHYLGSYHWLRHVFQADAIVHMGKHGTLEWLPGKGIGLSAACYPDVALGDMPLIYPFIINDPASDPSRTRVRELADEARRVFRTRVVNPKWVQSMQRHGYKGAFELAATVDYLFGYDATAQVVEDWMYTCLAEQYVLDPQMQQFFQEKNPWALRGIIERLMEAVQRGLWEQPDQTQLEHMHQLYLQLEGELEERAERS